MEIKKNRFFIFLFSLMPGAGQMYMGAAGKGVILMTAFLLWCCLFYRTALIFLGAGVLWFYSFMDTHSLKNLTVEEIKINNDDFVKKTYSLFSEDGSIALRNKKLGVILILFGIVYFITTILRWVDRWFSQVILGLFVTFIIIFAGIRMAKRRVDSSPENQPESNPVNIDNSVDYTDSCQDCSHENHIHELIAESAEEKRCPQCNFTVFESDKFCSNCGKSLAPEEPKERLCSGCGTQLSPSAKFCPHCGKNADESAENTGETA